MQNTVSSLFQNNALETARRPFPIRLMTYRQGHSTKPHLQYPSTELLMNPLDHWLSSWKRLHSSNVLLRLITRVGNSKELIRMPAFCIASCTNLHKGCCALRLPLSDQHLRVIVHLGSGCGSGPSCQAVPSSRRPWDLIVSELVLCTSLALVSCRESSDKC